MVYIIRHGQTDWNLAHKLQGKTDIPLNDNGRQMAIEAGNEVRKIDFDICYCSPLDRAKETARLLLDGTDTPIEVDDRLIEMNFGDYEGGQWSFDDLSVYVNTFFVHPEEYVANNGAESLDELLARTNSFLVEKIYPVADDKNILIVGHGAMNCSIFTNAHKLDKKDFWKEMTGNCQLKRLL